MRRTDREITDLNQIVDIMKRCDVCRLAFFDKEYPYIVPLNFGLIQDGNDIELYFHGATVGKKLSLIEMNHRVGFEMDCSHRLITGEKACDYSMEYESVIGQGVVEILTDEYKIKGLDAIMQNYSDAKTHEYNEKHVKAVTVFKVKVTSITGKQLKKNS